MPDENTPPLEQPMITGKQFSFSREQLEEMQAGPDPNELMRQGILKESEQIARAVMARVPIEVGLDPATDNYVARLNFVVLTPEEARILWKVYQDWVKSITEDAEEEA